MARYRYFLHRYDCSLAPVEEFGSRQALRNYMRSLPDSPSGLAEKYFLHVIAPKFSAIYNFNTLDDIHLFAVLSRKTVF